MAGEDKGKAALAVGALGLSTVALISALTRKVEAAPGEVPPTDEEIRQALALILSQQADLESKLEAIGVAQGVVMPEVKIEQIPFVRTLAIPPAEGSGAIMYEKPSFSGYIKEVTCHWPDGCDHLVDIRVGHGAVQFCPRDGYLALNDTTPTYPFNEPVKDTEEIWVEMRNRSGFIRDITVTVTIKGVA